jgi:cell filamentation protein
MLSRMYGAEPDPYCYPGTTVLINRLGTTDQSILNAFEAEMTSQRAAEPLPIGRLSYTHYRAIHRHFFQDVYAWAGRIRTVRMSKGSSEFCYLENIDREMRRLFDGLTAQKHLRGLDARKFAEKAAHLLAELNAIHPFREGNGRSAFVLSDLILLQNGLVPLDTYNRTRDRDRYFCACEEARVMGNHQPLGDLVIEWEGEAQKNFEARLAEEN